MNKLKLGILFLIGIFAISGLAMAQGENENANPIISPEQKQAKSVSGEHTPDEIIVKFKSGTSDERISVINSKNKVISAEKIVKKNLKADENKKADVAKKHGLDRIYLLKLPKHTDMAEALNAYNANHDVEYAEPNYFFHVDLTPNDPRFGSLWGLTKIQAPEAWDIQTGSSDIVVAVIDTGVNYNHVDLAANMWTNVGEIPGNGIDDDNNSYIDDTQGWNFYNNNSDTMDNLYPYDHGTHCAGTIAGVGNNSIGVVGVSWNAKIMPIKFLGPSGGSSSDAVKAIQYAIDNGADIMSNSWGGSYYSAALEDAISAANAAGILFIAAAGNGGYDQIGDDTDVIPHYPSSYNLPNIISVAATNGYDGRAGFSNYGLVSVDLGAPGVGITSTTPGNNYESWSGTSMATPHVAGAAALIMTQYPNITHNALKAKILDSVDPVSSLAGKTVTGGRLNVFNCIKPDTTSPAAITDISISDTLPVSATLTWTATGDDGSDGTATSYDIRYSTATITTANWDTATEVVGEPTPQASGAAEQLTVTGLNPETTYYFAIKASDEENNPSILSNIAEGTTKDVGYAISVTNQDIYVSSTITGTHEDTHASDNTYESIHELVDVRGIKTSYMEHKWTIDIETGTKTSIVFRIEAHHTDNTENDDFMFAYSTDDITYTYMMTVTKTADDNIEQSYELPADLSGTIYVRVVDTDRSRKNTVSDTLHIDKMSIHTQLAAPSYGVTVTIDEASQIIKPAESTTYTVRIKNTGDFDASYDIILDGSAVNESTITVVPTNWTTGTIIPGAEEIQTVTVPTTENTPETTYTLIATATCDQNESITDSATSDLVVSSATKMHIADIEISTIKVAPNIKAMAKVTIVDANNVLVESTTIYGTWSGLTSDKDSGTTDTTGQVSLDSDELKRPSGTYTFTVTAVTKDEWIYIPGELTTASITV